MAQQSYQKFDGSAVTESILQESSQLFNENYGVWSEQAAGLIGKFARAGKLALTGIVCLPKITIGSHIRLSKGKLRAEYLPDDTTCSYVRVTVDGRLAGNAFACRWTYDNKTVCWITQLVVHQEYRERGIAQILLLNLKNADDDICGIMSSHPAACMAAAKAFGSKCIVNTYHSLNPKLNKKLNNLGHIITIKLEFIKDHAEEIMKAPPINYVRDANFRGSLFNPEDASGLVSSVDTSFWVDHTLEALVRARELLDWPLGELHGGHEFLLIIEVRRRPRSRPQLTSKPKDTSSTQDSA